MLAIDPATTTAGAPPIGFDPMRFDPMRFAGLALHALPRPLCRRTWDAGSVRFPPTGTVTG